ncbi:MAG: hypothetical protein GXX99_04820 [Clostridiales bacterium]|nr:hypothetical protein [Clostridiales bacterium]
MKCEQARVLAERFAAGERPDGPTLAQLRAHLAACGACQAEYGWLLQLPLLIEEAMVEPPPGFAASVMARVREEAAQRAQPPAPPHKAVRRGRIPRAFVGLAAAALLLLTTPTALRTLRQKSSLSDGLPQGAPAEDAAEVTPFGLSVEDEVEDQALRSAPMYKDADALAEEAAPVTGAVPEEPLQAPPPHAQAEPPEASMNETVPEAGQGAGTDNGLPPDKQVRFEGHETAAAEDPAESDAMPPGLLLFKGPAEGDGVGEMERSGGVERYGLTALCEPDWTAILPTERLTSPEDVISVTYSDQPPEQYDERIEGADCLYFVVAAEGGYALVIVSLPGAPAD